jgi:hypothetical protein
MENQWMTDYWNFLNSKGVKNLKVNLAKHAQDLQPTTYEVLPR